jgi:hypothetical protein
VYGLSKKIAGRFDFKELEATWKKNPAVRQIYEKYLKPGSKWVGLKKILLHDLQLAHRMVAYKTGSIDLPEQRYLKKGSPLFDKYFHEFDKITYIVSRPGLLDSSFSGCCNCLEKWEWSFPMQKEEFCTPCGIGKWVVAGNAASNSFLACLTCCLPVPVSAFLGVTAASTVIPVCYPYARSENRREYLQTLDRFKAIKALNLEEKLRTEILALPQLLVGERINRDLFTQRVIESMQTAESIKVGEALPGLESLCENLKVELPSNSRSVTIEDLGLLNRVRFVASKAVNQDIQSPLSDEERRLIQNFRDFNIDRIQSLLLKHLSNVNRPEFLVLLPHFLDNEFNRNIFSLFVSAGLELEAIPREQMSIFLLPQLLDAGIFVNHPRILDGLSSGFRYDFALILFLYGYESPGIIQQLRHNAFAKFELLKAIQSKIRTEVDSTKTRSQLCHDTLKFILGTTNDLSLPLIRPNHYRKKSARATP